MKDSNLIKILRTFSKEEWKQFDKFLRSPYFNTNEYVVKFATVLNGMTKQLENELPHKEKIFKFVYPGRAYSDTLMRKLLSLTNKLTEEFIAVNMTINNQPEIKRKYLYFLGSRSVSVNFDKLFAESISAVKHQIESMTNDPAYEKYKIDYIQSYYARYEDLGSYEIHNRQIDSLLNFFVYEYSKVLIPNKLRESVMSEQFLYPLWNTIQEEYKHGRLKIETNTRIFMSIAKLASSDFETAGSLLEKLDNVDFEKHLSMHEKSFAYHYIIQTLILLTRKADNPKYEKYKLIYYKKIIDNLEVSGGGISMTVFYAAINSGLRNNEINWVKNFVTRYKDRFILPPEFDKSAFLDLMEARILNAEKKFDKSLISLAKINPSERHFMADVKTLTIVNLYNLGLYEEIERIINSYNKSLKKLSTYIEPPLFRMLTRFIDAVNELLKIKFAVSQKDRIKAELKIQKILEANTYFYGWLTKKFNELKES